MDYSGGFDNYEGGYNNEDTSFQNDSSQRQQTRSSLTPVTIKQINESTQPYPDGDFQINKVNLNMVSFIGIFRKIEDRKSALNITLEDGTGAITVRKWVDDSQTSAAEEMAKYESIKGKYVYCTGALKSFSDNKSIQNATIKVIEDHNEITYHYLQAISIHIKAQGITIPKDSKNDLFVNEGASQSGKSMDDMVLEIIRNNSATMSEGVPVQLISQNLNITDNQAQERCIALVETGKIYAAYDDQAYLAV
ncbi:replication factor A protein 2 [[Candida] jaroonii]|uniref:Replication factor A protein 2 n=1 Tax=[Candida] jaroonii TaxID=467808 RepID=A0ACA9Y631_9ASCO|nr:replication factor A protein 2 [[Candida] jaroonii]